MNKGILSASGKWLLFLGADDMLFKPTTLSSVFSDPISDQTKMIIGKIKYNCIKSDSVYIKKNDGLVSPSWSIKLWIKNSLQHQALFYCRDLFDNHKYSSKYKILSDYAFNLHLYNKRIPVKIINEIIAYCGSTGASKKYSWALYKEEIKLKIDRSSLLLKPLFFLIVLAKYLIKKNEA